MKRSELKQLIKDVIEESYESDLHDEYDRAIGTITEEAKKLWKATKPTEDEYAVLDGDFKYLKSFKGADAKVKSKEYADSIADKNTTGIPMGWPTIVKIVTDYGRAR